MLDTKGTAIASTAYQPPTHIESVDGVINILQLTDLHLYADASQYQGGVNCQHNFEAVLAQALAEDRRCDLILVTGDLVNLVDRTTYDYLFTKLAQTGIAFACIAGNHDVTDELHSELPFAQRRLIAQRPDPRLLENHVIETSDWQILLLNSAVAGQVAGHLSSSSLTWLAQQLQDNHKPALLALHHHIVPMQSAWIDAHMLSNPEDFWSLVKGFDQVKAIINGHAHQQKTEHYQGVAIYTTPATSYQFLPRMADFAFDTEAKPGYRWLQLNADGQIKTWVQRLIA